MAVPRSRNGILDLAANPDTAAVAELVAAPGAGMAIRVLNIAAMAAAANNVTFKSASTAKSPTYPVSANGGFVLPYAEYGWFQCAENEALNIELSAATAVAIQLSYQVVDHYGA